MSESRRNFWDGVGLPAEYGEVYAAPCCLSWGTPTWPKPRWRAASRPPASGRLRRNRVSRIALSDGAAVTEFDGLPGSGSAEPVGNTGSGTGKSSGRGASVTYGRPGGGEDGCGPGSGVQHRSGSGEAVSVGGFDDDAGGGHCGEALVERCCADAARCAQFGEWSGFLAIGERRGDALIHRCRLDATLGLGIGLGWVAGRGRCRARRARA